MPDLTLTCKGCGVFFVWTEKEQEEYEANLSETEEDIIEVEAYCKICRPKQDGQRS